MAAHLFGYVSEVTEAQLQRADYKDVESGAIVGQAGVEQAYNRLLMGTEGNKTVVVNSLGREIDVVKALSYDPKEGQRLQLTIDADVQKAAEDGFTHSASTAPPSSSIRATARCSRCQRAAAYDPNTFAAGIDRATWASLIERRAEAAVESRAAGHLFARVDLQDGRRPRRARGRRHHAGLPGALHRRRDASTAGTSSAGRRAGTASIDLRHAIEQSCDVYFYTVGNMLGVDRIHKWATLLGLGDGVGIDLPNELKGLVPSTEWKRGRQRREVVRRRDDLGRDRPGTGVGDADVAGGV